MLNATICYKTQKTFGSLFTQKNHHDAGTVCTKSELLNALMFHIKLEKLDFS